MNNNQTDLLIVDFRLEGFNRYATRIVKYLKQMSPDITVCGCYFQDVDPHEIEGFDYVVRAKDYNYEAQKILSVFKPKVVLTFAHRFFDYMFVLEAHHANMKVINFQHAIYMKDTTLSEMNKKTLGTLINSRKEKMVTYTKVLLHMCGNPFKFISVALKLKQGNDMFKVINDEFGKACNADVSVIYGQYWERYYKEVFHETQTEFFISGYPDLNDENVPIPYGLFPDPKLPVLCYLAQPYCEDGIITLSEMDEFLEKLWEVSAYCNLLIKPHPRNNMEYFSKFENNDRIKIWKNKAFPICGAYIGHDSTILLRAMYHSKTMIYRITPDRNNDVEHYTKYICQKTDHLQDKIKEMFLDENYSGPDDELGAFVSFNRDIHPLEFVAKQIQKMLAE